MSKILLIELKEFDATTLSGSYQNFGSVLSNPAIKMQFFNTSDVDCYISIDATTNYMRLPAGSVITFDENTVRSEIDRSDYYFSKGMQISLLQSTGAATSGNIIAHIVTRIRGRKTS